MINLDANVYWQLFLRTGSPELYLMYNEARRAEETDVFDDSRAGSQGNAVQ